jgi:hypothetical protein
MGKKHRNRRYNLLLGINNESLNIARQKNRKKTR